MFYSIEILKNNGLTSSIITLESDTAIYANGMHITCYVLSNDNLELLLDWIKNQTGYNRKVLESNEVYSEIRYTFHFKEDRIKSYPDITPNDIMTFTRLTELYRTSPTDSTLNKIVVCNKRENALRKMGYSLNEQMIVYKLLGEMESEL